MCKQSLYNHLELCTHLYHGNLEIALKVNENKLQTSPLTSFTEKKNYLCSLNLGIYNYILLKENVALTDCCHKNMELIFQNSNESVQKLSEEIILSFANCKDYLIEKHQNEHIRQAIQYIHNHLHEPLSLEVVSKQINLNKCYLSSLFKEEVLLTFSEYVTKRRVEFARQLLRKTSMTLSMIADASGFTSESYLCVCFKKEFGISPCRYRKDLAS